MLKIDYVVQYCQLDHITERIFMCFDSFFDV